MIKIKRALISVSDKTGIIDFARELREYKVEIISTGGTATTLQKAGIEVVGISHITKFPEMMEGRVKTLHPAIHGALLARRDNPEHLRQAEEHKISLIDMVVVNLYPFRHTISKKDVTEDEAIENIDIGGPSMIRSAAKNFSSVVVVVNPREYKGIIQEMKEQSGCISYATRKDLMVRAFQHTADYDATIYNYFKENLNDR